METGIYVTWRPKEGSTAGEQCCRLGSHSMCLCGQPLKNHEAVKARGTGYIKPPTCQKTKCPGFRYAPGRPEECGQFWFEFLPSSVYSLPLSLLVSPVSPVSLVSLQFTRCRRPGCHAARTST